MRTKQHHLLLFFLGQTRNSSSFHIPDVPGRTSMSA